MKSYIRYFIPVVFYLGSFVLSAQTRYKVDEVPNVQLKNSSWYVSDPEYVLTEEDTGTLNGLLAHMRDSFQVEAAVVVLPYIDTELYGSAKDFANLLFNDWGLGKKETDRGLLILLLTGEGEREITFETGYGIEGELTDGMSKVIQTQKMIPLLKELAFGPGLIIGVQEISKVFDGTTELVDPEAWTSEEKNFLLGWLIAGFVFMVYLLFSQKKKNASPYLSYLDAISTFTWGGCLLAILFLPHFFLFSWLKGAFNKRILKKAVCPLCGSSGSMRLLSKKSRTIRVAVPGQKGYNRYTFVCKKCGQMHYEDISYDYVPPSSSYSSDNSRGGSSRSSWGGSSRSSWGGSSGGSWGGGRSGGGGASSKF